MFLFVRKLDHWLIMRLEKHVCHPLQRNFGVTIGQLILATILAYCGCLAHFMVMYLVRSQDKTSYALFFGLVIITIWLFRAFFITPETQQRRERYLEKGLANPEKILWHCIAMRLYFLGMCISDVGRFIASGSKDQWSIVASTVLLTTVFYLEACDGLPPCRGKVWEQIAAFFGSPAPQKT